MLGFFIFEQYKAAGKDICELWPLIETQYCINRNCSLSKFLNYSSQISYASLDSLFQHVGGHRSKGGVLLP